MGQLRQREVSGHRRSAFLITLCRSKCFCTPLANRRVVIRLATTVHAFDSCIRRITTMNQITDAVILSDNFIKRHLHVHYANVYRIPASGDPTVHCSYYAPLLHDSLRLSLILYLL